MKFQNFVVKQLEHAGVAEEHRLPIYKANEDLFRKAFTHHSFTKSEFADVKDANRVLKNHGVRIQTLDEMTRFENYEKLEFKGDRDLKSVHGRLLANRYPELDQGQLTFAFQELIKEKVYALESERLGFFEQILMSDAVREQAKHWKAEDMEKVNMAVIKKYFRKGERENVYFKLLEDTYEAFACALVESVDLYTKSIAGPGHAMLFRWGGQILDHLTFDPTANNKAPGMQLKELWEDIYVDKYFEKVKFTNNMMFVIDQKKRGLGYIPIKAVDPFLPSNHRDKVIAETHGKDEKDARRKASIIALKFLNKWKTKEIEAGRKKKEARAQK